MSAPGPNPDQSPDLTHVETWIFDLDNTLYPPECEFMALIDQRMTAFVMRETGLAHAEARTLQLRYLDEHGTTLAGLVAHHGVDPHAFLDEVHDVSLDRLTPDDELARGLARLPGRRLVFTNGSAAHAERVLERLGVRALFEAVFHLEAADFTPKPRPGAYHALIDAHAVDPRRSAFFEDSERNLQPAAELGMTTILVGPHAEGSTAPFVHHRTPTLAPFLRKVRTKEAA
jgi:putative hydrolase of the HAD superfamily